MLEKCTSAVDKSIDVWLRRSDTFTFNIFLSLWNLFIGVDISFDISMIHKWSTVRAFFAFWLDSKGFQLRRHTKISISISNHYLIDIINPPKVLFRKDVPKICRKFIGSKNQAEVWLTQKIALWHGCSPINSLYIFKTPFKEDNCGGLLLHRFRVFSWVSFSSLCLK